MWRVVIVYDDPRGGTWRGPIEDFDTAKKRFVIEAGRAHGTVRLEKVSI